MWPLVVHLAVRFWPTGDGLHLLKPEAQDAAPKVSFAVLYSPVARPGLGQYRTFLRSATRIETAPEAQMFNSTCWCT